LSWVRGRFRCRRRVPPSLRSLRLRERLWKSDRPNSLLRAQSG
jgi:hypothetical protein